jgi:hypothetical protein
LPAAEVAAWEACLKEVDSAAVVAADVVDVVDVVDADKENNNFFL